MPEPLPSQASRRRSPFARLLLVGPGEWRRFLLSAGYFFCLLASYYTIRPIRDQMGVAGGVRNLPWLMTATLAAMLLVNPLYGVLVSCLPRRRFVPLVYRFFALNLVLFWAVFWAMRGADGGPSTDAAGMWIGRGFYVWTSVFNLFVVSVFWSTMVDAWSPEQAKRLFASIGIGGTLGAIVGAASTQTLVDHVGPLHLLLLSALLLECAVACFLAIARDGGLDRPGVREPGPDPVAGLRRAATSPYLLTIALYMLLFTTTGTLLYVEQARIVEDTVVGAAEQTQFFARVDLATNALTLVLQLFVTGRLVMMLGLGAAVLALPLLTLAGFGWLSIAPTLMAVATFQVVRRAAHYAVDRPAREALYSVLDADDRYKAKSLIDTFVYRAGDVAGAWAPKLVANVSALPAAPVLFAGALTVAWIGSAVALGVQNARRSQRAEAVRAAAPP